MNTKFKISGVLASLMLSTMLVGCGGSSKDSSGSEAPKPETPKPETPKPETPIDARKCSFTPAIVEAMQNKSFDASKSIQIKDGNGQPLLDGVFKDADKVDTKSAKDYTITASSPSCDNTQAITVKVKKASQGDAPTLGDPSLGQFSGLVIK